MTGLNEKPALTPKLRMLNAYRGIFSDRRPVAPEFWYYYPAKLLGVDFFEFGKTPFHRALKTTFEHYGCEGWGCIGAQAPARDVEETNEQQSLDADSFIARTTLRTPKGTLTAARRQYRHEPAWTTERMIKDFDRDLPAFEYLSLRGDPYESDFQSSSKAWKETGNSYLLEFCLGNTFFDFFAENREGGFETAVIEFMEREKELEDLRLKYVEHQLRLIRAACAKTPFESFFVGCSWSCNSLLGPAMWRRWDKPCLKAMAEEIHRQGRLLHVHFHGRCIDTVRDFAEIGIDCVCPFERPPGGDVRGLQGLKTIASELAGRTTFNGNIHTVETLIRGGPNDVRREVNEVLEAFEGSPRVIVGTGDQVGGETPEANLHALFEAVWRQT